jgi:hypothetical protein
MIVSVLALGCDLWTADKNSFNALKDTRLEWIHRIEELTPLA